MKPFITIPSLLLPLLQGRYCKRYPCEQQVRRRTRGRTQHILTRIDFAASKFDDLLPVARLHRWIGKCFKKWHGLDGVICHVLKIPAHVPVLHVSWHTTSLPLEIGHDRFDCTKLHTDTQDILDTRGIAVIFAVEAVKLVEFLPFLSEICKL